METNQHSSPSAAPLSVPQIQQAITQLSEKEYNVLAKWLIDHDFNRWDNQIVDDLNSGRLDSLIDEAEQEYKQGKTEPL